MSLIKIGILIKNCVVIFLMFISGDVDFIIRFGVLDKVYCFLKFCCPKTSKNECQRLPFIDEKKNKQAHLQEMCGEEIVRMMGIGRRVVRGTDWKWDNQVLYYRVAIFTFSRWKCIIKFCSFEFRHVDTVFFVGPVVFFIIRNAVFHLFE